MVDLSLAGIEANICIAADIRQVKPQRRCVVIVAGLAVIDQSRHHLAGNRRVLELVAAGAAGHVEARQT